MGEGRSGGAVESPGASAPRTLESTVAEDVGRVASALDLDASMRSTIEELTLRAFRDFLSEQERDRLPAEEAGRVLSRRQAELHERILELLPPAKRALYRDTVGLGP